MPDPQRLAALQQAARQRIFAQYRTERRYPGTPTQAMARVAAVWATVAADYVLAGQQPPWLILLGMQVADDALAALTAATSCARRTPA